MLFLFDKGIWKWDEDLVRDVQLNCQNYPVFLVTFKCGTKLSFTRILMCDEKNSNAWSLSNEVCSTEKELQSQRVFNQTWIKIAKFVNKWPALCKYFFSKKPITPLRSVSETSAHWINLKPKHISCVSSAHVQITHFEVSPSLTNHLLWLLQWFLFSRFLVT